MLNNFSFNNALGRVSGNRSQPVFARKICAAGETRP